MIQRIRPSKTHHVLIGPKGKRAGRIDQKKIAMQLHALQLTTAGSGGGIVSTLLPRKKKDWDELEKLIDRGYSAKEVKSRSNYREDVRNSVRTNNLIAKLAVRFERERRGERYLSAAKRELAVWICEKLSDPIPNEVKRIVGEAHPELLNMTKADWWKKRLNRSSAK